MSDTRSKVRLGEVKDHVEKLLIRYPQMRRDPTLLIKNIWGEELKALGYTTDRAKEHLAVFVKLTYPETITRARRAFLNKRPDLKVGDSTPYEQDIKDQLTKYNNE